MLVNNIDYEKFLDEAMKLDPSIRLVAIYDGQFKAKFREGVERYFEDEESMQENTTSFINLKTKMSFQGEIGKRVDFDYHLPSGRYYAKGLEPPMHDITEDYEIANRYNITLIEQSEDEDYILRRLLDLNS